MPVKKTPRGPLVSDLSALPVANNRAQLAPLPLGSPVNYGGNPGTVVQRPVRTTFPGVPQNLVDMYLKEQKKKGLIKTVQYTPPSEDDNP